MCVRKVKRKCYVKGCKNTECFAISRTREFGNTIIVCKDCLEETLSSLSEMSPEENTNVTVTENRAVPSLFFNAKALGKAEAKDSLTVDVTDENSTTTEDGSEPEEQFKKDERSKDAVSDAEAFVCPECGKEFDSMRGLTTHLRYCKPEEE